MGKKEKILFVCTGNSCRSQMAEGLMRNIGHKYFQVYSAGSNPSRVHPNAIEVMAESGIDISNQSSDLIDEYLDKNIDIVITVCDNANEVCPIFSGHTRRIHWSIDDPFQGWDTNPSQLDNFRKTRDDLYHKINELMLMVQNK